MSTWSEEWSARMFHGTWRWIAPWLRVPTDVPTMPIGRRKRDAIDDGASPANDIETFKPADGFLRYLKFWFWLLFWPMDVALLVLWIALGSWNVWIALAAAPLIIVLMVVPDLIVFVAIHLRYEATWYVMTDRAIRIRRGIWIIRETTISFENVQNVMVRQGPVQRHYGISNVIIETAGSGGASTGKHGGTGGMNQGIIEGISDAARIRDVILRRLRESKFAGLGDEEQKIAAARGATPDRQSTAAGRQRSRFSPAHVALLREIRDLVRSPVGA